MPRTAHASIDDYLAARPVRTRAVLETVRSTIRAVLPGATEGISYQMPVYKIDGVMVLYFAGYRNHYSIYPATALLLDSLKELAGRLHSKATIRFSYDEAVPKALIKRIARLRAAEARERLVARAARRAATRKPGAKRSGTAK